jgi:hypothetical protein
MLNPVYSFTCLAEAVILFSASLHTLKKLYQGSKSKFAYLLTAFAFAYAFCSLAEFIMYIFPDETV